MPKATIEEQETVPPEEQAEAPPEESAVPEEPVEEEVPVPKKAKAKAKTSARKDAPPKKKTNLKERHTCGACGQEMSLHTALYGHKNCPGNARQPPALVRQVATEPAPVAAPEPPQMSQAQMLRLQLAQAAQERRAQAHMRMVAPIRQFYGL